MGSPLTPPLHSTPHSLRHSCHQTDRRMRLSLLTFLLHALGTLGLPSFQLRLPNGMNVACPPGAEGCLPGDTIAYSKGQPESVCLGLGHASCTGGTMPLNPFGADFVTAGRKWFSPAPYPQPLIRPFLAPQGSSGMTTPSPVVPTLT